MIKIKKKILSKHYKKWMENKMKIVKWHIISLFKSCLVKINKNKIKQNKWWINSINCKKNTKTRTFIIIELNFLR